MNKYIFIFLTLLTISNAFTFKGMKSGDTISTVIEKARQQNKFISADKAYIKLTPIFMEKYIRNSSSANRLYMYRQVLGKYREVELFFTKRTKRLYRVKIKVFSEVYVRIWTMQKKFNKKYKRINAYSDIKKTKNKIFINHFKKKSFKNGIYWNIDNKSYFLYRKKTTYGNYTFEYMDVNLNELNKNEKTSFGRKYKSKKYRKKNKSNLKRRKSLIII